MGNISVAGIVEEGCEIELELSGTDAIPLHAEPSEPHSWRLTLHPCFRLAAEEVLHDLARHLRTPAQETANRLRRFVRAARQDMPAGPRRRPRLEPLGRHFDLAAMCAEINARHFGDALKTKITWGKTGTPRRRRRRSIVFGSYDAPTDTIRIHPDLDSGRTPRVFLEYIVFHELLHAVHPVQIGAGGRRVVHTREFKRDERRFPDLRKAMEYLKRWSEGELA